MVMYIELSACGLHSAATVFNATPGRHQVCCTPTERDINTCNKTKETETETHTDTEKDTEREGERETERERGRERQREREGERQKERERDQTQRLRAGDDG